MLKPNQMVVKMRQNVHGLAININLSLFWFIREEYC